MGSKDAPIRMVFQGSQAPHHGNWTHALHEGHAKALQERIPRGHRTCPEAACICRELDDFRGCFGVYIRGLERCGAEASEHARLIGLEACMTQSSLQYFFPPRTRGDAIH